MKTKNVGMLVSMLLITTALVSATTIEKEDTNTTSYEVDVPVWENGDSWTYTEHYNQFSYRPDGTPFFIWYQNCTSTYTVTDDTGDTYTLKLTSKDHEGRFTVGSYRIRFTPITKYTQEIEIQKSDLAYVEISSQLKGFAFWLLGNIGFPIPAYFSDVWNQLYTPAFVYYPFPLSAGTNGTLPGYIGAGHETFSLYWGLIKFVDMDFSFDHPAVNYSCEMASITVPAGTYDAYNVSIDVYSGSAHNYTRDYYVPELGYYAKYLYHTEWVASGKTAYDYKFDLVSTTYTT